MTAGSAANAGAEGQTPARQLGRGPGPERACGGRRPGQLVVRVVVCQRSDSAQDGAAVLKKRMRIKGASPRDTSLRPALQGRLFGVIIRRAGAAEEA